MMFVSVSLSSGHVFPCTHPTPPQYVVGRSPRTTPASIARARLCPIPADYISPRSALTTLELVIPLGFVD